MTFPRRIVIHLHLRTLYLELQYYKWQGTGQLILVRHRRYSTMAQLWLENPVPVDLPRGQDSRIHTIMPIKSDSQSLCHGQLC